MRALRSPLWWGGAIVALLAAAAVLAPVVAPHDPKAFSGESLEGPSARHLLGTNDVGQDTFSQILWGARPSLAVALGAASLATLLGALIGMGAGFVGGLLDAAAMRVVDLVLALPGVPLMVVVAALAGPSLVVVILIIGFIGWPLIARMVRAQAMSLRQRGYIYSARGFGAGRLYVLRRHLAPGVGPIIVAGFLTWFPVAVLLQAGLAFLGLGDPSQVSWGLMLNRALNAPGLYFTSVWVWLVLPAGIAISLTVLGFTFIGVGLESRFNPRALRSGLNAE